MEKKFVFSGPQTLELENCQPDPAPAINPLPSTGIGEIKAKIQIIVGVIEELHKAAEEALWEAGLDPGRFALKESALHDCIDFSIESFLSPVRQEVIFQGYRGIIDGVRYVVEAEATSSGKEVTIQTTLVKLLAEDNVLEYVDGSWRQGFYEDLPAWD